MYKYIPFPATYLTKFYRNTTYILCSKLAFKLPLYPSILSHFRCILAFRHHWICTIWPARSLCLGLGLHYSGYCKHSKLVLSLLQEESRIWEVKWNGLKWKPWGWPRKLFPGHGKSPRVLTWKFNMEKGSISPVKTIVTYFNRDEILDTDSLWRPFPTKKKDNFFSCSRKERASGRNT